MSKKPLFDDWVYKTLKKYGNVALPYYANEIDKYALKRHLEYKVGFKVKLRQAKMNVVEKPYYIAEEKYENHSQN